MDRMRGRIISAGSKPQFEDFLKFLKHREKTKEKVSVKQKDQRGRPPSRVMSLTTGVPGQ